jgi:arylsulfatase A-like enzyme
MELVAHRTQRHLGDERRAASRAVVSAPLEVITSCCEPELAERGTVMVVAPSNRRNTLAWLAGIALLLSSVLIALVSRAERVHASASPPNILFIVTDDQRFATLGFTDPVTNKPWMDKTKRLFKDEGEVFQWAYDTTPECCPSRSSIFTGRYAHNHGVHSILPGPTGGDALDQNTTLQHYLQQAGYRTGIFGKYLNSWDLTKKPPMFDRWGIFDSGYYWSAGQTPAPCDESNEVCVNERDPQTGLGVEKPLPGYSTTYVSDGAVNFIQEAETNDAQPWFLYVAPYAPHLPATPEKGKYDNYPVPPLTPDQSFFEADTSDKPPYVRAGGCCSGNKVNGQPINLPTTVLSHRDNQLRTLKSVDDMVGRIFSTLQQDGEDADTLAIFVSDNGYLWGEHGLEGKLTPYTLSVRAPLFARWPARVSPGAIDTRLTANIDLAPTAMAEAGLSPATAMDGKSLLDPAWTRDRLLTEFWREQDVPAASPVPSWASIRKANNQGSPYEYTEYYADNPDGTPDYSKIDFREYYDLAADPLELTNLLGGNGKQDPGEPDVSTLSAQLAADRGCTGSNCP